MTLQFYNFTDSVLVLEAELVFGALWLGKSVGCVFGAGCLVGDEG